MKVFNDTAFGSYALETSMWLILNKFCWIVFTVFIVQICNYCKGSYISCFNCKRSTDVRLAFQISVGLTVNERNRKRTYVIWNFKESTKNHQCYSTCWKCWPPGRTHSDQLRRTLFTLQFLPRNLRPQPDKRSSVGNLISPPIHSCLQSCKHLTF